MKRITRFGALDDAIKAAREMENIENIIKNCVDETMVRSILAETDDPTTLDVNGTLYFFANGTPITVSEKADGGEGALISWDGGSMEVTKNTNIFGGRHNDYKETNTDITITGGTVKNVLGGGLHASKTIKTKITMTGGTVTSVSGGGASSLTKSCGCANGTTYFAGDPDKSPCQDYEIIMNLSGGVCKSTVYGGGEGISNTREVVVNISGDFSAYYVTAGGSNGKTLKATVNVSGSPVIEVLQGVNRGEVCNIQINVIGTPTINHLYAGGEVPFTGSKDAPNANDASGIFEEAILNLMSTTNVANLSYGGCDYEVITEDSDYMKRVIMNNGSHKINA